MPRLRIFVSGATDDYLPLRQRLADRFRSAGMDAVFQESLFENGFPTLTKLDDNLRECLAVVHLVGPNFGTPAGKKVVDDLLERLGEDKLLARQSVSSLRTAVLDPSTMYTHSYTQWEAYLAKHYNIGLLVYCPADQANFDERQTKHLNRLNGVSAHAKTFEDEDKLYLQLLEDLVGVLASRDPAAAGRLQTPPPCHLPYPPLGELFLGRKAFLDDLRARFDAAKATGGALPNHAIHGLGGVGKTRVAVEYAWQHRDAYSGVFFVNGESDATVDRDLAALGDRLSDADLSAATDPQRRAATIHWLRENPGWLLIVDNVDDNEAAAALSRRLADFAFGHVLITGRVTLWPSDVVPLELHVLDPVDAKNYLLQGTPARQMHADDDQLAFDLANKILGSLCLPLTQSAAYIDRLRIGFTEYKKRWQENLRKVRAWGENSQLRYHEDKSFADTTATTWLTSFQQLTPAGRGLLDVLAWLAPDPLPIGFLTSEAMETGLRGMLEDESADAEEAAADLRQYSFLSQKATTENTDPQLHRVVQLIARDRGDQAKSLPAALSIINASFVGDPDDVRSFPTLEPLAPHVQAVTDFADSHGISEPTSLLMNQLGLLFNTKAEFVLAELLFRRTLAIDEKPLGPDHPEVAIRLNNLAQLLQDTNRLEEAEPLMRRALEIGEESNGPDHPNVAIRLNNLAQLLQDTNRLEEAEPLMRRALKSDEKSFGPEHPSVARGLNNLAQLLKATNRLAEAEPLMRRALEIHEKSFGPDHPNVATGLNNLAVLLQNTNRLKDAEPLMRRALEIGEESFGPDHPSVARGLSNLALLLQDTNRLEEAEPIMRRAFQIIALFKVKSTHTHPNFQTFRHNFKQILLQTGVPDEECEARIEAHLKAAAH